MNSFLLQTYPGALNNRDFLREAFSNKTDSNPLEIYQNASKERNDATRKQKNDLRNSADEIARNALEKINKKNVEEWE
jgi:hypothetical protein